MIDTNYKIYGLKAKKSDEIKYIGLTTLKLKYRLMRHLRDKKIDHKTNWIKKIGKDNVEIIIIEENITDFRILYDREIFYIAKYKAAGHKLTNIANGGQGTLGVKLSQEHKDKVSLNHADVSGDKNPMYGKTHTNEVKQILKDFHTGRTATPETKLKMSKRKKGENNNKAKLTEIDVLNIRKYHADKTYTSYQLSLLYNVQIPAINKIIKRINWKHI